jgi:hypothetical protein
MNTQVHQHQPTGLPGGQVSNTVAFLFGAIFNILANTDYASLIDYALKAVIGGVIWLLFKILGDYISYYLHAKRKSKKQPRKNDKQ